MDYFKKHFLGCPSFWKWICAILALALALGIFWFVMGKLLSIYCNFYQIAGFC